MIIPHISSQLSFQEKHSKDSHKQSSEFHLLCKYLITQNQLFLYYCSRLKANFQVSDPCDKFLLYEYIPLLPATTKRICKHPTPGVSSSWQYSQTALPHLHTPLLKTTILRFRLSIKVQKLKLLHKVKPRWGVLLFSVYEFPWWPSPHQHDLWSYLFQVF